MILGFLTVICAGAALFYLSARARSHDQKDGREGTAVPARTIAQEKEHEAKILATALKKKPDHTPVLLRLAQLSEESGRYSEAAARLREIVQHEPGNSDAHLELGRVLFQTGDVQGAIEQTKAILDRLPDHADALYNLGAIYANLGNGQLARTYWNRLVSVKPQSESAQRARTLMPQLPPGLPPTVANFHKSTMGDLTQQ